MTIKALDAAIAAHIATGQHTLAWAIEIVRADAVAFRFCSGTREVTIAGDLYTPIDGLSVSSIASTAGLSVDNGKITVGDSPDILREDILDGVWDDASYRIFQYNWASPSDGIIPWPYGFIADAVPRVGAFDLEFRDLRQALQQDTTRVHAYECPYVLGDARCTKDLTAFTFAAVALSSVTSTRIVTASSLAQAADYFTNGRLLFTTGANANGVWRQIADHAAGGVLTLTLPLKRAALAGDQFTIIAGCDHQPETCKTKFANKANYGGCDTKPTRDELVNGALA